MLELLYVNTEVYMHFLYKVSWRQCYTFFWKFLRHLFLLSYVVRQSSFKNHWLLYVALFCRNCLVKTLHRLFSYVFFLCNKELFISFCCCKFLVESIFFMSADLACNPPSPKKKKKKSENFYPKLLRFIFFL